MASWVIELKQTNPASPQISLEVGYIEPIEGCGPLATLAIEQDGARVTYSMSPDLAVEVISALSQATARTLLAEKAVKG